jgi:putative selenium metabolism protein SsnA
MPSGTLLIKNGTLITLGAKPSVLIDHSVLVENGMIKKIADRTSFKASFDREIDASGMVVMPGFINIHTHFYSAFVCGIGGIEPANNFTGVLKNLWWRLDRALTLDDCYYSAFTMLLEGIRHGVTAVIDHHSSPFAITGSLDRVADAVREVGVRACLCYEVSDRDGVSATMEGLAENVEFHKKNIKHPNDLIRTLFGLHASFTLSDVTLEVASRQGRELGMGFHIHVAESEVDQEFTIKNYGSRVVERLNNFGILNNKTIAAHCVHVNEREIEILADTSTIVAHNPQSNLNNAVGISDILALQRENILVGLGTDAMTTNMTEELRVALWAQHLRTNNPSTGFMETAETLLKTNAIVGKRIWDLLMGEISEGAAADLIMIPYNPRTPMFDDNVYGHILYGISQMPVDTTIVAGKVLMHNRKLQIDIDEDEITTRAREQAKKLWARM